MAIRTRSVLTALFVGAALSGAAPAFASDFLVEPVAALLSPSAPSALLDLTNTGAEPVRFELTGFTWSQDPHGGIVLTPTDNVIFFPQLFTIAAGEKRKIRVGSTMPATDTENSYRLFVEELPSLETEHQPVHNAIVIRSRFGIPVFVSPAVPRKSGEIESLSISGRQVSYQVHNTGNVHVVVESAIVKGLNGAGGVAFTRQGKGWYVLAGQTTTFDLLLSPEECAKAASIELSIRTESLTFDKTVPASPAQCGARISASADK
jgi:fimbrial chaperone protein